MYKVTSIIAVMALTAGCMQEPSNTAATSGASEQTTTDAPQAVQSSASTDSVQVTVDDNFGGYIVNWSGNGAETFIRYRPVIENGQMYICGAYTNRGGSLISRVGRQIIGRSSIRMNGETVLQGLSFFNIVSSANREAELVGSTAFCRNTGLSPSQAEFSTVEIFVPSGRVRIQI